MVTWSLLHKKIKCIVSYRVATARRRYPMEEEYQMRPKRPRGTYDYYKPVLSAPYLPMRERDAELPSNRYTRDRSYQGSSQAYSYYTVRDYHHRPPPMAPLPYPPPPPFDSLPPPPRYYDGPPLPDFPPSSSRSTNRTPTPSPYEKSVSEFLRRTSDSRREHERERERDLRERERKYRERR